ncbi:MAG TPA: gamma-glutamyl-gamma-aminobutyrate hydrolase family protein [Ktedonobacteraceae bacterium]|nr:gamma-glutamyl-gamma-aminobutyrate hydrolase family protein [Ktedonobacteraceae bacterium]
MRILSNHILVTNPAWRKHPADTPFIALRTTIANALGRAKLIPIAVGPEMHHDVVLWLYEQCAGVVFTGGADWNPKLYNQQPLQETGEPQNLRDEIEQLLFTKALADKKPLVGICRGMQGLAIALYRQHMISSQESILIQHIAHVSDHQHTSPYELMHTNKHEVTIHPETLAHEIFKNTSIFMPSSHHQAVSTEVALKLPYLVISGVSTPDGLAEIMELDRTIHPFCFAVQGHPEVDSTLYPLLFQRLAQETKRFAKDNIQHSRRQQASRASVASAA